MKPKLCSNPKCAREFEPNTTWQAYCRNACRVATFLRVQREKAKEAKA